MTTHSETTIKENKIDPIFLNQASFLCQNAEHLPEGVEGLAKKLQKAAAENRTLNIKLGLDPTRPDLHLGHTVVLRKLRQFQEFGHNIILIIGDATALIGDPSGRNNTRPPLTEVEVKQNAQTYLDQASIILDVSRIKIVHNSEWLYKVDFVKLLELCSKVTVAQLLTRDDFSKRYEANQPISFHEFLYPLMQAYDSVAIESDIELGGTDQMFNLLLGRDIQQAYGFNNLQSALMMPLIEGTDGKVKMSKSYPEHCINITDKPDQMFGKLMSIPDEMITRYLRLLTTAMPAVVDSFEQQLQNPQINPRDMKAEVAKWIIRELHSMEAATDAEQAFIKQFKEGGIPDDIPEILLHAGSQQEIQDILVAHQLAASKSEVRRLIDGGGVKMNQEKVTSHTHLITGEQGDELIIQVGKRKFIKLKFN